MTSRDVGPAPGTDGTDLTTVDDKELLRRHAAGDAEAFGELFRRHKDRMWAVALRTCGDPDLAADAVQEGFISAMRRGSSYRGDAAVTTWLHRIVVNASVDRIRRQRPTALLDDDVADARDETARVDTRLEVQEALALIPEAQRLALVLVDMHGYGVAESAELLGVAEGTVKSRCSRGRATLANLLGREPREDS